MKLKPSKRLSDYSNEELLQILEEHEEYPHTDLSWVCSEVLRRFITLEKLQTEEITRNFTKKLVKKMEDGNDD